MRSLLKTAALMVTLLVPLSAVAGTTSERQLFLDAQQALKAGNLTQFHQVKHKLKDYVLYPYVEYAYLERYLSNQKPKTIAAFLSQYEGTPVANQLRYRWLLSLAKRERWQDFVNFYAGSDNDRMRCHYWHAHYQLGNQSEALAEAKKLWMVGKSRPQSCDTLFKAMYQKNIIGDEDRWNRAKLAMANNKLSLASYLSKNLDNDKKAILALWQKTHRKPNRYLRSQALIDSSANTTIARHGILRLARHKPELAWEHFERLSRVIHFSEAQKNDIRRYIGKRSAQDHSINAYQWYAQVPRMLRTNKDKDWIVRAAVIAQDWAAILDETQSLTYDDAKRLHYWRARALEITGNQQQAREIYEWLAQSRNYYGFLAADRQQLPYHMQHETTIANQNALDAIAKQPAVLRAEELRALKLPVQAHREWDTWLAQQNTDAKQLAAVIAFQWGWHDQAVQTANRSGLYNDLTLRFPVAFQNTVNHYSNQNGLETSLTFSVMRRESSFREDAKSPAGAMGLMQIMPTTGKQVARSVRSRLKSPYELLTADRNIELGTTYLKQMLNRFQDNPVLATAAYNAGPHRVKRWLPEQHNMEADIWQEAIPYDETRTYTRDILAFSVVYDYLLNKPGGRMSERMPEIRPKG